MDGFSSAAAVIQLLAVTGACGNKLLKLIHTTKHAPSEIMAISNELSDLTLILNNLEGLIATEQKSDWPSTSGIAQPRLNVSIEKHVINAKAKLSNLQSLVDQLCTILPDGSAKVRRMAWARKKSIANTLQQDLISAKEILKLALDTRNAFSSLRVEFSLQAVEANLTRNLVVAKESGPSRDRVSPQLLQDELEHGTCHNRSPIQEANDFGRSQMHQNEGVYASSRASVRTSVVKGGIKAEQYPLRDDHSAMPFLGSICQLGESTSMSFHVSRVGLCRGLCNCSCHYRSRYQTPKFLNQFLGTLFIGYTGLPYWDKTCDQPECSSQFSRTVTAAYTFPQWFLSRTLNIVAAMTHNGQPSLGIRVKNRVKIAESDIFTLARLGDTQGIIEVFNRRRATIDDLVYHSGQTILQVAFELGHIETCKMLIDYGIDTFIMDDRQTSAAMEISKRILQHTDLRRGPEMERAFLGIAAAHSQIWEFSHVHKVVVGISHADLIQTLHDPIYSCQIDSLDCQGRTPLHWAALRGDEVTIKTLLLARAGANVVGEQNRSPLHYAIESGSIRCVELILMAGCSVHRQDIQGHAALHVAAWARDMPEMLETIYLAGAALELKDNTGCTALECAANMNYAENVKFLLSTGADIDCRDSDGSSPLFEAVRYSNYDALQVLLDHKAKLDYSDNLQQTVLHLAAAHASTETVRLLGRVELAGLAGTEIDIMGRTFIDVFVERVNPPAGLAEAMNDIMQNLNVFQRKHSEDDHHDEGEKPFVDAEEFL